MRRIGKRKKKKTQTPIPLSLSVRNFDGFCLRYQAQTVFDRAARRFFTEQATDITIEREPQDFGAGVVWIRNVKNAPAPFHFPTLTLHLSPFNHIPEGFFPYELVCVPGRSGSGGSKRAQNCSAATFLVTCKNPRRLFSSIIFFSDSNLTLTPPSRCVNGFCSCYLCHRPSAH